MNIVVKAGDISSIEADAVVVDLFEGVGRPGGATGVVDTALDGAISKLIMHGEIKGKLNEVTVVHSLGRVPARVVA
ncbi:MAG: leucyl aminopeptidase, partial [Chloroflexi bacterium]|nr:leucyl aminopeptidase [Chloroflexota bacterium]